MIGVIIMNIVLKICVFAGTALLGAICGGVAVSKMNKANNAPAEPSPNNTATSSENTTTDTPASSEATE